MSNCKRLKTWLITYKYQDPFPIGCHGRIRERCWTIGFPQSITKYLENSIKNPKNLVLSCLYYTNQHWLRGKKMQSQNFCKGLPDERTTIAAVATAIDPPFRVTTAPYTAHILSGHGSWFVITIARNTLNFFGASPLINFSRSSRESL